jgi:integrase
MRLYRKIKRGTGKHVWWASWTEASRTIRRSTRCDTREAAQRVAERWELERVDPGYAAARAATLGGEAVTFIRESEGHVRPATLSMYKQKAGNLLGAIGPTRPLADIDAKLVAEYIELRRGEGASESTIYKEWITLRMILKSARHRGAYHRDPGSLKPPRFGAKYVPKKRFLTWQEVAMLLPKLPLVRRQAVAFVICTGARRAELQKALVRDVRADVVHIRGTKTDDANRIIPIPPPFRPLWAELRVSLETEPEDRPILMTWHSDRRDLARACRLVGIDPVTWNDLRRTFASLLIQAGVAPHVVAKLMGHRSTAMVDLVYGRTDIASLTHLMEAQAVIQLWPKTAFEQVKTMKTVKEETPEIPEGVVGRPGLEPGTYGLKGLRQTKVTAKEFRQLAHAFFRRNPTVAQGR